MATIADLKARRGNSTERRAGRREATSSTKCNNFSQFGHYKEIEVCMTSTDATCSNQVSTVRWEPLHQRVPTDGNGKATTQQGIGVQERSQPRRKFQPQMTQLQCSKRMALQSSTKAMSHQSDYRSSNANE